MNGKVIPHTPLAVDFWQVRKCAHVRLFFLSHMHSDHTSGLTSTWANRPIYCSPITAKLLKLKLQVNDKWIHPLELSIPHKLPLDDVGKETMTVTLIDASHCPGAVMFLFEGYFGNILYTGDFRYNPLMFREPCLSNDITIDVLYLDNTNCDPTRTLPSRAEATKKVKEIIRSHPGHRVVIGLYSLGKEDLLVQLALEFKAWVEVRPERMETVQALKLLNVFTTEPGAGRIRVVNQDEIRPANLHQWNREEPTIAILPTSRPMVSCHPCLHVVPYSDHSSYQELEDFISALQPISILPIVGTALPSFSAVFNPRKKRHKIVVPDSVQRSMADRLRQGAGGGTGAQDGGDLTLLRRAPLRGPRGVVFESPPKPPRPSALQRKNTSSATSDASSNTDPDRDPGVDWRTSPAAEEEVDSTLNGSSCILLDIEQGSIIDLESEVSARFGDAQSEIGTALAGARSDAIVSEVSTRLGDAQNDVSVRLADVKSQASMRLGSDKSEASYRLDSDNTEACMRLASENKNGLCQQQQLAEKETELTLHDDEEEGGSESSLILVTDTEEDSSQCLDPPGSCDYQPALSHSTATVQEESSPSNVPRATHLDQVSSLEHINLHDNTCVATAAVTPRDPSNRPFQSWRQSQASTEDMGQEEQRLLGSLDFSEEELGREGLGLGREGLGLGPEVLGLGREGLGLGQVFRLCPLNVGPKRVSDPFEAAIKRFKAALA